MIILFLLVGVCFYVGLTLFYFKASPTLHAPTGDNWFSNILDKIQAVVMQENEVMMILRCLLLVIAFYVVADWLLSTARQQSKKHKLAAEDKVAAGKLTKINP